jgi:hypothetical protein
MDDSILNDCGAERLRLRADLWRRDAKNSTNRHLSQLMLHAANELDEEAAELDGRAKGKAKQKTKPSESSKGEAALIAELDKGPLGA